MNKKITSVKINRVWCFITLLFVNSLIRSVHCAKDQTPLSIGWAQQNMNSCLTLYFRNLFHRWVIRLHYLNLFTQKYDSLLKYNVFTAFQIKFCWTCGERRTFVSTMWHRLKCGKLAEVWRHRFLSSVVSGRTRHTFLPYIAALPS